MYNVHLTINSQVLEDGLVDEGHAIQLRRPHFAPRDPRTKDSSAHLQYQYWGGRGSQGLVSQNLAGSVNSGLCA